MEQILFIPVDSRPVSVALPRRIADCGGVKLRMPPARRLGGLDAPADTKGITKWLRSRMGGGEGVLILSVDSLLFGGLVFSREPGVELDGALETIGELAGLKKRLPDVKIFAFQSVLRDAITVRDGDDMERWKEMMAGGRHPEWFLGLRKRNLSVARRLVELAGEGVVDCLVLAKEDTSPDGPFLHELEALRSDIETKGAAGRAFVTTGTDEAMLLLLARRICTERKAKPKFLFAGEAGWKRRIPPYEHQPLWKTLNEQVRLVGGDVAEKGDSDAIEVVVHFHGETPDIFLRQLGGHRRAPTDEEAVKRTMKLIRERLWKGRRVALLDCAFANGGNPQLVKRLLEEKIFFGLFSYAGWNTHANRAGNLVAHAAVTAAATERKGGDTPQRKLKRHVRYMMERAVHDCVYSSVVRGRLVKFADAAGKCLYQAEAKKESREQMAKEAYRLFRPVFGGPVDGPCGWGMASFQGIPISDVGFPWGRLFEIDCRCEPEVAVVSLVD